MSDKDRYDDDFNYHDLPRCDNNDSDHKKKKCRTTGGDLPGNRNFYGQKVDVVIVGTGAGGGMALEKIANSGATVVALEKGPNIPDSAGAGEMSRDRMAHDELMIKKFDPMTPSAGDYPQTWRKDATVPTYTSKGRFSNQAELVGGSVVHYATHCWRAHPSDFNKLSAFGPVTGANMADWPITYDDLEPYYTEAEYIIGTSGDADITNPWEPPHSRPYPNPPLGRKLSDILITEAAARLGRTVYPMTSCARSREYDGGKRCHQCSFCSGYMCDVGAKGNSRVANIPHALATGNVEIRPDCYVTRVLIDSTGRCTGVEYIDTNSDPANPVYHVQECDIVVMAAACIVNTQILLRSGGQHGLFPNGLGNTSGLLGKNYFTHISGSASAVVGGNLDNFIGIGSNSANQDFYEPDPSRGFINAIASMVGGGATPLGSAQSQYPGTGAPSRKWGLAHKQYLRSTFDNVISFGGQNEMLPRLENAVDLDPVVVDKWGLPAPRLTVESHPDDILSTQYCSDRGKEVLNEVDGVISVWGGGKSPGYNQVSGAHLGGTARMGTDISNSVTNRHCQFHDVPNLFVATGDAMVTMPPV